MKRFAPVILTFAFALIAGVAYIIQSNYWNEMLVAQQAEIDDLQSKIKLKNASDTEKMDVLIKSTTGLDTERVEQDNKIASEFLKQIMTWSSYDEYTKIREDLMLKYNLTEYSNFMNIFMPEVINSVSPDGTSYNRIDTLGLNMKYEGMNSYVTNFNTDVYTYFSVVEWSSSDKNRAEASTTSIFTYSINSDGQILDIDANTIQY